MKSHLMGEHAKMKSHLMREHAEMKSQLMGEHAEMKSHLMGEHAEMKSHLMGEHAEMKSHLITQDHKVVTPETLDLHSHLKWTENQCMKGNAHLPLPLVLLLTLM
jgi:hypothetical protein